MRSELVEGMGALPKLELPIHPSRSAALGRARSSGALLCQSRLAWPATMDAMASTQRMPQSGHGGILGRASASGSRLAKEVFTRSTRPLLIVIAGPPLSGKSTLRENLLASFESQVCVLGVSADEVKTVLMPGRGVEIAERNFAYLVMHYVATLGLRHGTSVVLDATYARREPRQDLANHVHRMTDSVLLIQCSVEEAEAEKRLVEREKGHPAVDLTPSLVRERVRSYPFKSRAPILDSVRLSVEEMASQAFQVVQGGEPIRLVEWTTGGTDSTTRFSQSNPVRQKVADAETIGAFPSFGSIRFGETR